MFVIYVLLRPVRQDNTRFLLIDVRRLDVTLARLSGLINCAHLRNASDCLVSRVEMLISNVLGNYARHIRLRSGLYHVL